MNITDILNNAVAYFMVIGGIGTAMVFLAKVNEKYNLFKKIQDWIIKPIMEKIRVFEDSTNDKFGTIIETQKEQSLDILALKVVSKGLPEEARYYACKRYLQAQGNSGIDVIAESYIENYKKKHE